MIYKYKNSYPKNKILTLKAGNKAYSIASIRMYCRGIAVRLVSVLSIPHCDCATEFAHMIDDTPASAFTPEYGIIFGKDNDGERPAG